ncbi:MAG: ABC transporter ATP-binding protein [Phycisphaerales bacterium]|nr:ABC transporter ATP-binding protein [Phycisphaerales bacterium]
MIRIKGLRKVYRVGEEQIHALRGLDLQIGSNEMVAVMGVSGSGKSTLMNIIGCLDRPSAGSYELDSKSVAKMTANQLALVRNEKVGFVFQSFELLARQTALENVELPLIYSLERGLTSAERRRRALEALDRVRLTDRVTHRPNQLSGGQRQRVAIARAILNRPAILMADEPTGNLDSVTSHEIMEIFRKLHQDGQTVLIVTHENDIAAYCQRVVRLKDGQILSDLSIAEDTAGRAVR